MHIAGAGLFELAPSEVWTSNWDDIVSYDLQVWTTHAPNLPIALPDAARWQQQSGVWIQMRSEWQVIAGPVHRVEPEDVPEAVRALLPGIGHMVELNLEPTAAPQLAYALLRRVAKALAFAGHGVVVDPQTDSLTTPTGVRRYVAPARSATLTALELSWFSVDGRFASRDGLDRVVACFERSVHEALPVRYGEYEPPSFRYSETGRQHLVDFLANEYLKPRSLGFVVWYPKRPVLRVGLSIGVGKSPAGWGCHRLTLTVEASVLEQGGWPNALHDLWRRLAQTVHAFYADVRILRRYRVGAATVAEFLDAERHPVCGPFWAGIPREGACAVALGQPYLSLWPEFDAVAEREDGIGFLSEPSWMDQESVFARSGPVPERLAQQSPGYDGLSPNRGRLYPSEWPFRTDDDVTTDNSRRHEGS